MEYWKYLIRHHALTNGEIFLFLWNRKELEKTQYSEKLLEGETGEECIRRTIDVMSDIHLQNTPTSGYSHVYAHILGLGDSEVVRKVMCWAKMDLIKKNLKRSGFI